MMLAGGCRTVPPASLPIPADPRPMLRLGAIPSESATKIQDQYQDFIRYLERETDCRINFIVAQDYGELIEMMRAQKVDVAFFGPYSYIIAHESAGAQAFASPVSRRTGSFYYSLVITHVQSGVGSVEGLKGRSFAFVDDESTSGYLIPRSVLAKRGVDPERDLGGIVFSGGHDASVIAVKRKTVDAAAVSSNVFRALLEKGIVSEAEFRILYQSPPIPQSTWAYRQGLSPKSIEKIKTGFLNAHLEPGALGLYGKEIIRFISIEDAAYNIIRETAKMLKK